MGLDAGGVVRHGPPHTSTRFTTNGGVCRGLVAVYVEGEEVVVGGVVGFGAAGEFEGGDGEHEVGGEWDVGGLEEEVLGEAAGAVAGDFDGVAHGLN